MGKFDREKEFEIYCNHGVLAAEYRNVYTYGGQHPNAVCSDRRTVELPENDYFDIYETADGELAVETVWGYRYSINEVLGGDKKPCFSAPDKVGKLHRVFLIEADEDNKND